MNDRADWVDFAMIKTCGICGEEWKRVFPAYNPSTLVYKHHCKALGVDVFADAFDLGIDAIDSTDVSTRASDDDVITYRIKDKP